MLSSGQREMRVRSELEKRVLESSGLEGGSGPVVARTQDRAPGLLEGRAEMSSVGFSVLVTCWVGLLQHKGVFS